MTRRDLIKAMCRGALIVGAGESMRLVQPRRAIAAGAPHRTEWPVTILGDRYPEWRRDPKVPGFGLRGPFGPIEPVSWEEVGGEWTPHSVRAAEYKELDLFSAQRTETPFYTLQYVGYCPQIFDSCPRGGQMYVSSSWSADLGPNPVGEIDARVWSMELTLAGLIDPHRAECRP